MAGKILPALFLLAPLLFTPAGCGDIFDNNGGATSSKITLSGTVSETLAKPALKPGTGAQPLYAAMGGGELKVLNAKGETVGSTTIGADGGYTVSVAKGSNYILRATKGNVCLKSFVLKADASKTVMVDPNSSAVVKVLAQKLGNDKLGEEGEDVSAAIAAADVSALIVAINSSYQSTAIPGAIEADITANADYTATAATVSAGAASTAGDAEATSLAASITTTVTVTAQSGAPSAPTGVTTSPGDGWVTVSWGAVTDATSYNLYYSTTAGTAGIKDGSFTGTSTTVAGLTNDVTYYFTITAVNASGESAGSAQTSALPRLGTWTTKTQMPATRYAHSTAVVNGIVYVIGGYRNQTTYSAVEAYDPATDTWTTKAPMPTARTLLATVVVDGIIYAIGGQYNDAVSTVEAYNPATDTWTTKAPMSTARGSLSAAVVNGIIYAIGGEEYRVIINNTLTNRRLSTVEAYDPATDTWTTKAPMPTARNYFSANAVNGIIYAIAGSDGAVLSKVEAYDPVTNKWTTKASVPTARTNFPSAEVNGIIYVISGNKEYSFSMQAVDAYDPVTNTWVSKPLIPTGRHGASAAVVNGAIYVFGGVTYVGGSGYNTVTVEMYR